MAKDDYDVILCKLLIYLYAIMKRKTVYSDIEFEKTVRRNVNEDYFIDVLRLAQEEGLIRGVVTTRVWGGNYILLSTPDNLEITPAGIRYLKENSAAQKALKVIFDTADIFASLASAIGLHI